MDENEVEVIVGEVMTYLLNEISNREFSALITNFCPSENPKEDTGLSNGFYLDECGPLLEQVPKCFDLGLIGVFLKGLTISRNYFAFGSVCGALFLYNRRINQSVKPLRTSHREVITCLRLACSPNGLDLLSVGHQSGTLIILLLPSSSSGGNRKMNQSIIEDVHKGCAVTSLCWSDDTTKLFSADSSGLIVMTHVDFCNNEFISIFVSNESGVYNLLSTRNVLLIVSETSYKVVNTSMNCDLIFERCLTDMLSCKLRLNGATFYDNKILLLTDNGLIFAHDLSALDDQPFLFKDLKQLISKKHPDVLRDFFDGYFSRSKLLSANNGQVLVCYSRDKLLICTFIASLQHSIKIEVFDFCDASDDVNSLEILDIAFGDSDGEEIFVLANNQHCYRLGRRPALREIVGTYSSADHNKSQNTAAGSSFAVGGLLKSLSSVAQKSGLQLFEKLQQDMPAGGAAITNGFNFMDYLTSMNTDLDSAEPVDGADNSKTVNEDLSSTSAPSGIWESSVKDFCDGGEDDVEGKSFNIYCGESTGSTTTLPFGMNLKEFGVPDEYSTKIVGNLQNMLDHLKKNSGLLNTDFDGHAQKTTTLEDELSDELFVRNIFTKDEGEEDEKLVASTSAQAVSVSRLKKKKAKASKRLKRRDENEGLVAEENGLVINAGEKDVKAVENVDNDVDANLERILSVIGVVESLPMTPSTDDVMLEGDVSGYISSAAIPLVSIESASLEQEEEPVSCKILHAEQPSSTCLIRGVEFMSSAEVLSSLASMSDEGVGPPPSLAGKETDEESKIGFQGKTAENVLLLAERDEINANEDVEYYYQYRGNAGPELVTDGVQLKNPDEMDELIEINNDINGLEYHLGAFDDFLTSASVMGSTASEGNDHLRLLIDPAKSKMLIGTGLVEMESVMNSPFTTDSSATNNNFCFNRNYVTISRFLNHNRCDLWDCVPTPFAVGAFDVCERYAVVCRKRGRLDWRRRMTGASASEPHFCRLDDLASAKNVVGKWTPRQLGHFPSGVNGTGSRILAPTSAVFVNDSGSLIWRTVAGVGYLTSDFDPFVDSPRLSTWREQSGKAESEVLSVAFTSQHAWYLAKNGVFVQMYLPEMGIFFCAECPFPLRQLTACDHAVWGLSDEGVIVARVGLNHCPMGTDWADGNADLVGRFLTVALFGSAGFGLDERGDLWMIDGVNENNPFGVGAWYRVYSLGDLFQYSSISGGYYGRMIFGGRPAALGDHDYRLRVCSAGIFLSTGSAIVYTRKPVTGFLLSHAVPRRLAIHDRFALITAGGFCGLANEGVFVCGLSALEIFSFSISRCIFTSLPPLESLAVSESANAVSRPNRFKKIGSISASGERLFALDIDGRAYMRTFQPFFLLYKWQSRFNVWTSIPTDGLSDQCFRSLSASSRSVWALDWTGRVFYAPTCAFDASLRMSTTIWAEVARPSGYETEPFDRIFVSPVNGFSVWVLHAKTGLCWARVGLSDENPQGKLWLQGPSEMRMRELAVGENVVWGLSYDKGRLCRLIGLSRSNPTGIYWKTSEIRLKAISTDSVEDRLWALDCEDRIVRHQTIIYPKECLTASENQQKRTPSQIEDSRSVVIAPTNHSDGELNGGDGGKEVYKMVKCSELPYVSPEPTAFGWMLVDRRGDDGGGKEIDERRS